MTLIKITGEIGWDVSARRVRDELEQADGDITVEINSPGGYVYEGISIFNALKAYDKGNVEVVIAGLAASMASYIALAGDRIKAYDNAVYMIHNAWGVAIGDFREMKRRSLVLEGMSNILKSAYSAKSGKSESDITAAMNEETFYFGNEILANGFIDEIIPTNGGTDDDEAKALAGEAFKMCVQKMKDEGKEDFEQIAASLKDISGVNPASAKIENKIEGETMEVDKNAPKVGASSDNNAEAIAVGPVAQERARVTGILALSGCSDVKNRAIENGISVGDCAIELNKNLHAQIKTEKADFEKAAEEVQDLATEGTPEAGVELSAEEKAIKADDEAYYKTKRGEA